MLQIYYYNIKQLANGMIVLLKLGFGSKAHGAEKISA